MRQIKGLFSNPKIYIVILLIVTGLFVYLRSVNKNLMDEEIIYFYVFEGKEVFDYNAVSTKIKTFSDIIESQINHFNTVNGRTFVHTIEQYFSGIAGIGLFYILNTGLFLFTIYLFVKVVFNQLYRYHYWLFTTLAFLYFFPEQSSLWLSINLSLNYLLPMCLTLLVIFYWNKLKNDTIMSNLTLSLMPILGFVAGWSHEAFAVSLSVTLFFYYCFNHKQLSVKIALLIFPLWIGTSLLVFAPGNFVRLQIEAFSNTFINWFKCDPLTIKLLPILIVLVLVMWSKKSIMLKQFIVDNLIWVSLFVFSLLFVLLLGIIPGRTYISVELYSLILIIKLIKESKINLDFWRKHTKPLSIAMTLLFIVHQGAICNASIIEKENQDRFIKQYIESSDGVAIYDIKDFGCLINPYIKRFKMEIGNDPAFLFHRETMELYYSNREKKMIPLPSADYVLISNFDNYDKDKLKYSGPFYTIEGCKYAWAEADSVHKNEMFEYQYSMVSFADEAPIQVKMKRLLMPNSYSISSKVNEITEVTFNSRKFLAIKITPMRNVVDIKPIRE